MNRLPLEKRVQILSMLCEGSSMRSISRVADVSINTVSKLLVDCRERLRGHCQTNLNGPAKGAGLRRSGRQLTPLGKGGRTVLFEDVAAVEVTVVVEVIVD